MSVPCSICKLQGRAGRVNWRSVNAPLAYLMGGIGPSGSKVVFFVCVCGCFFMFPMDKHSSCPSSHGEQLIIIPPSSPPKQGSADVMSGHLSLCFPPSHTIPALHPDFWGEIPLFSHPCRLPQQA